MFINVKTMYNRFREQTISSVGSISSDSDLSEFNKAFQDSSNAGLSTFDSTYFRSTEAVHPTDSDESDLRRLIENDTILNNITKNDVLYKNRKSPSVIIAAGSSQGSTVNTSIDSLQSTILGGAMNPDLCSFSQNDTLLNIDLSKEDVLNKRISSDDEYKDCLSSPETETPERDSTKYKSLGKIFSPTTRSENNNTIFKTCNNLLSTQVSKNTTLKVTPERGSRSGKYFDFSQQVQHLTTILEESRVVSFNNSNRISGAQLLSIVGDLQKNPKSQLPENKSFNDIVKTFADILNKSSKEITIDELSYILLFTLKSNYNYSDCLNSAESFPSFRDVSREGELSCDTSGKELDSIIRELRLMYPQDRRIDNESSPEWPVSAKSLSRSTAGNSILASTINCQSNSFNGKKEYFPQICFSSGRKSNKENQHLSRYNSREKVNNSPAEGRDCFPSKLRTPSNFRKICDEMPKKKYAKTPYFRRKEPSSEEEDPDATSPSEQSFKLHEKRCNSEFENIPSRLRRSISLSENIPEESTTYEVSKISYVEDNQKAHITLRRHLREEKKHRRRRSKSLESNNYFSVQTNNEIPRRIHFPSTSGTARKMTSSQQKIRNPTPKILITSDNGSICELQTPKKIQCKTSDKISCFQRTVPKNAHSRRSSGIDNTHIPAVSQLRKIFSPAARANALRNKPLEVPRIEVTKSSPERSVNTSTTPILSLRHKNRYKSSENLAQRKPWRP